MGQMLHSLDNLIHKIRLIRRPLHNIIERPAVFNRRGEGAQTSAFRLLVQVAFRHHIREGAVHGK